MLFVSLLNYYVNDLASRARQLFSKDIIVVRVYSLNIEINIVHAAGKRTRVKLVNTRPLIFSEKDKEVKKVLNTLVVT